MSLLILAPEYASNSAISPMILFTPGALLEPLEMEHKAPRLSDRSSTDVFSPMWWDHDLRATSAASASHRVVKAESPRLALKLHNLLSWMMSAKYAVSKPLWKRMPPMPQGLASVEILTRSETAVPRGGAGEISHPLIQKREQPLNVVFKSVWLDLGRCCPSCSIDVAHSLPEAA